MYYIYVLQSQSTGKTYIGQTCDLVRRLEEHNDPGHSSRKFTTKQKGPWKLIHHEELETRAQAIGREKWLKSGVGRDWIKQHVLAQLVERSAAAD